MPIYTDEEGNEVELDMTLEEAQERLQKADEFEKTLSEKETELEKLRNKSENYTKLNFKNKQELKEATADWSEREKMLLNEISELKDHNDATKDATVGKAKTEYLTKLAGGDEKMQERLEREFEALGGDKAVTPEQVQSIAEKAQLIVEHDINKSANPLNTYQPSSVGSGMPSSARTDFADTDRGKEIAKALGMQTEAPKTD